MKVLQLIVEIEVDDDLDLDDNHLLNCLSNMENQANMAGYDLYDTRVEEL